jgi:hypothetical protein
VKGEKINRTVYTAIFFRTFCHGLHIRKELVDTETEKIESSDSQMIRV